jgi:hypothetical protein
MASINVYPLDTLIAKNDKVIGTDSSGTITKNYSFEKISDFFNSSGRIQSNSSRFVFKGTSAEKASGTISLNENVVTKNFSDISNVVFSKFDTLGTNISAIYEFLEGSRVIIQKASDVSVLGVYDWTTSTVDSNDNTFFDVALSSVSSIGAIEDEEEYLVYLLQYDVAASNDKFFSRTISIAQNPWTINHNMNKFPAATIVLSTGQKGYGDVTYVDNNNLTISFAGDESGKVYLN